MDTSCRAQDGAAPSCRRQATGPARFAASEARHIGEIARRTVISDDALSVLVPLLEEIGGHDAGRIRAL